jgi:integrase
VARHRPWPRRSLPTRPGRTSRAEWTLSNQTVRHNLSHLRSFFERIIEWDRPDAPRRVPIFARDVPQAGDPLPKFLDDPTAAKFMAALAVNPDRRRRLMVELLARTGMRSGPTSCQAMTRRSIPKSLCVPNTSFEHVGLHVC